VDEGVIVGENGSQTWNKDGIAYA